MPKERPWGRLRDTADERHRHALQHSQCNLYTIVISIINHQLPTSLRVTASVAAGYLGSNTCLLPLPAPLLAPRLAPRHAAAEQATEIVHHTTQVHRLVAAVATATASAAAVPPAEPACLQPGHSRAGGSHPHLQPCDLRIAHLPGAEALCPGPVPRHSLTFKHDGHAGRRAAGGVWVCCGCDGGGGRSVWVGSP